MTFSLEQALAEYFNNTGGGGVWYGGTGQGGQIAGAPTGGGPAPTGSGAASGSSAGGSVAQLVPAASGIDLVTLLVALFSPSQATTTVEAAAGSATPVHRHGGPDESWFNQFVDAMNIPHEERRVVYSHVPIQYPQPPEWYYMNYEVRPWPEPLTWPDNTWPGGPLGLDPADDAAQQYYPTGQFWESWFTPDSYYSYLHLPHVEYYWTHPPGLVETPSTPPATPPATPESPDGGPHKILFVTAGDDLVTVVAATVGTSGNDLVAGDGLLLGGAGDDTLNSGAGDDVLVGGAGNNLLHGGAGADNLDGTGGWGVADYHDAATAVTVNLDGSGNSGDQAAGDTFKNINGVQGSHFADTLNGNGNDNVMTGDAGNDTVSGGGGNDTLYGSDGDDQLVGGDGNDRLAGGGGNNVLEGGAGADTLDGSYGWGVADYRNAHTAVTVHLDGSGNAGDEAAGDVYIAIDGAFGSAYGDTLVGNGHGNWIIACGGDDTVSGGIGNDTLYGADGNDVLDGGADNDVLYGGSGSNVLTGGSGRDVFVFDVAGSVSRITDFNTAEDKIQLDHSVFAGLGSTVSLAIGSMATNGGPQVIYNSGTGDLSYDADGLGGGLAVKFASLAPGLALTANNFLVM